MADREIVTEEVVSGLGCGRSDGIAGEAREGLMRRQRAVSEAQSGGREEILPSTISSRPRRMRCDSPI